MINETFFISRNILYDVDSLYLPFLIFKNDMNILNLEFMWFKYNNKWKFETLCGSFTKVEFPQNSYWQTIKKYAFSYSNI